MKNPYSLNTSKWMATTKKLLEQSPLSMPSLVNIVLGSWEDIFHSKIGLKEYQIGKHIWPEPQIIGFLLHEIIPLNLAAAYPGQWRRGAASDECD